MHTLVAKSALVGIGTCFAVGEIPVLPDPLSQFSHYGTTGLALFLVFWMLWKTLPAMVAAHAEQLKQMMITHAEQLKQQADANAANTKQFVDFLNAQNKK